MRERQRRYEQTDKGRATRARYKHSLKGMAAKLRERRELALERHPELRDTSPGETND